MLRNPQEFLMIFVDILGLSKDFFDFPNDSLRILKKCKSLLRCLNEGISYGFPQLNKNDVQVCVQTFLGLVRVWTRFSGH